MQKTILFGVVVLMLAVLASQVDSVPQSTLSITGDFGMSVDETTQCFGRYCTVEITATNNHAFDVAFLKDVVGAEIEGVEQYSISYPYTYTRELFEPVYQCGEGIETICNITDYASVNQTVTGYFETTTDEIQYRARRNTSIDVYSCDDDLIYNCAYNYTYWDMRFQTITHQVDPMIRINSGETKVFEIEAIMEDSPYHPQQFKWNLTLNYMSVLHKLDPFFNTSNTTFGEGLYNRTEFNVTENAMQLNASDSLQEFPNSLGNDSFEGMDMDMTGNILLMHFNNNTGVGENTTFVYDWSGNNNNGTWFNGGLSNGTAKLGNFSASFDGSNDFLNLTEAGNPISTATDNLAILTWVKWDGNNGGNQVIFTNGGSSTDGYTILLIAGENDNLEILNGDIGWGDTDTTLTAGEWQHVAIVRESATWKAYLDGVELTVTGNPTPNVPTTYTYIGGEGAAGTWNGEIDEFSFWERSLSAAEVKEIYDIQKGNFYPRGIYESEVFDAGSAVNWSNVSWVSSPIGELPNNLYNESADTRYVDGIDMRGNVLLMHFNNDSANGENETNPKDWSGMGNNGTWTNLGQSNGTGKLGAQSGFFSTTTDQITISNEPRFDFDNRHNFTISLWVNQNSGAIGANTMFVSKQIASGNFQGYVFWKNTDNNINFELVSTSGGANAISVKSAKTLTETNEWVHLVATYNGSLKASGAKIYVNGVKDDSTIVKDGLTASMLHNDPLVIGNRNQAFNLNSFIDEVAIWNRSLTADEIYNLYRRGAIAKDLNLSVRSCDDSACDGESWVDVTNDTSKVVDLENNYGISNNRYFQYQYKFSTDDGDSSPLLYNVTVEYNTTAEPEADTSPPTVTLNSPLNTESFPTTASTLATNFNCTATDATGVQNVSLWGNFTGVWQHNETNTSIANTNNEHNFTKTLELGHYEWNCFACDTLDNCGYASSNYTFFIQKEKFSFDVIDYGLEYFVFNFTQQTNITPENIYGEMWYHDDVGNLIDVITSGVYQNITDFNTTDTYNSGVRFDNNYTLTIVYGGLYHVGYSLAFSGAANAEYAFDIGVNGTPTMKAHAHRVTSGNDVGSVSGGNTILRLGTGDVITVMVRDEAAPIQDPTMIAVQVAIQRIED